MHGEGPTIGGNFAASIPPLMLPMWPILFQSVRSSTLPGCMLESNVGIKLTPWFFHS